MYHIVLFAILSALGIWMTIAKGIADTPWGVIEIIVAIAIIASCIYCAIDESRPIAKQGKTAIPAGIACWGSVAQTLVFFPIIGTR
jgi:hypothetical protein